MLACPYCHQPAMSRWEKLKTRPRDARDCRSCGKKVSVPLWSILAILLPIAVGAFIADGTKSLALGSAAILFSAFAAVCCYLYAVPLVGRD